MKKEAQRFIGAVGFLNDHILKLTELMAPLQKAISLQKFNWDSSSDLCFNEVKKLLISPESLVCFDPSRETFLMTDASHVRMGGFLSQNVAYHSKTFSKMEQNYSTVDHEFLAMVTTIEHFQHLLLGKRFTL